MKFWTLFCLFFFSGASGLIYQVVWSRLMGLLFGRSVLAVGIVLAAFMAGLALGGYFLGRYADRHRNPLRLYALYEVGIGLTAGGSTFLLLHISPVYVSLHSLTDGSSFLLTAARFLMAFLIILIPTILMGATLPILSRVVIDRIDRVANELGRLYAINTLGAVAGTIAAGFVLIRLYGLLGAVFIAIAGNLAVGLFAWKLSRSLPAPPLLKPMESAEPSTPTVLPKEIASNTTALILFAVFALSGLASFAYEIFWTRSLVFLLGNTTYAFSLMLTAFLAGIALGGYLIRFPANRAKSRIRLLGIIEILIGLCSAASLPLLFYLIKSERVSSLLQSSSGQFGSMVFSDALIALALMLVPATLIGATLPLMGQIFTADLRHTSLTIGRVYAVNTLGNVVGALLPGLLILPLMGIQKGILLMAFLNICLGLVTLSSRTRLAPVLSMAAVSGVVLVGVWLVDLPIAFQFPSSTQTDRDAVLFYEEGGLVTTKVWKKNRSGNKIISVDGINIGGTNDVDYKQQILAHLPKLLLKSYSSELSIGLGSGILIGESGQHQQLERIVCAEIAPSVVKGAGFFQRENYAIMTDPRTEIVVDDIGHFLNTSEETYDIISADGKTDEKYSTNAFSYSKDYYHQLSRHLAPGGLAIQWIPTALPSEQYYLVLRTFLDSFPHVSLWYFPPVGRFFMSNTFLIGSNEPVVIDPDYIQETLESKRRAFKGIGKYGLKTAEDILVHYVADRESLMKAVPAGPTNSVQHPYYEFYSPSDYNQSLNERVLSNHSFIMNLWQQGQQNAPFSWQTASDLKLALEAQRTFLLGHQGELTKEPFRRTLDHYRQAIDKFPQSESLRQQIVANINERFRHAFYRNDYNDALGLLRLATQIYPEGAQVYEDYGLMLRYTGQLETAKAQFQKALSLDRELPFSHQSLAAIFTTQGDNAKASNHWRSAIAADAQNTGILVGYGVFLIGNQKTEQGIKLLDQAYLLAPKNPEVIHAYAQALYQLGDLVKARRIVEDGGPYHEAHQAYAQLRKEIMGTQL